MTDARKRANKAWDEANYATVSCRMNKAQAKELRAVLVQHGLTVHTFLRRVCELAIDGQMDELMMAMRAQMTRPERGAELDAIVRGD